MQNRNVVVLDTLAASGADISLIARKVNITGAPAPIQYPQIYQVQGPQKSLVATPYAALVSFTAVNNQTYQFTIQQNTFTKDNLIQTETITYTSDSTATLAEIRDAFIAQVNAKTNLKITASASGNNVLLTAQTGFELFSAFNIQNVTVASNMLQTATIASNTTAAQTEFTTSVNHGLVVGQVITITTSDATKFVAGTYRIDNVSAANKFKLTSVDGQTPLAGTATATGTITLVAQYALGTVATVTADGGTGTSAGSTYTRLVLDYSIKNTVEMGANQNENELVVYYNEGSANYAAFAAKLTKVLKAYDPNGVDAFDADPQGMAAVDATHA